MHRCRQLSSSSSWRRSPLQHAQIARAYSSSVLVQPYASRCRASASPPAQTSSPIVAHTTLSSRSFSHSSPFQATFHSGSLRWTGEEKIGSPGLTISGDVLAEMKHNVEAKRSPPRNSGAGAPASSGKGSNESAPPASAAGSGSSGDEAPPSSSDDPSSSSPPPSSNSTSVSKRTVPDVYPQVLALPITRRPLFPGFYKAVVVREPAVVAAIKDAFARNQPYIGAFLLKDENADSDMCVHNHCVLED